MDLKIGDLCWAKMRGYPSWPGKILNGPNSKKSMGKKKLRHYIYFFGSDNYAWVAAHKIKPNSEEAIKQASQTRWLHLRKAIQQLKIYMAEDKYYDQGIVKKCYVRVKRLSIDTFQPSESNSFTPNEALSLESCHNKITEPPEKIRKSDNSTLKKEKMIGESGKSTNCQEMMPKKLGFIGHGEMGREIVNNLLKSKCDLVIWSETSFEYELSDVQQTADSFLDLIVCCDIILCYVDSEDNAQSFLKGDKGILESFASYPNKGKGFVLLANVDLQDSAETATKIQASGARCIGAHIIGSKIQAVNGQLLILCSGDQSLFYDCKSVFASFQRVKYLGPDMELASKYHTTVGLFLNSVSKSYKETLSLLQALELPLPIFNGLLKTVFDERSRSNLSHDLLEKKFNQEDRIRFLLEDLDLKILLAVNFPM